MNEQACSEVSYTKEKCEKMTVDFLNFNLIVLKESLVKASMIRSQGINFNRKKNHFIHERDFSKRIKELFF